MTKSCIIKIVMGGAPGSGKTTFLNIDNFSINNEEYHQIGVSFKLIDCLVNNKDSYLLQIWDLKTDNIFKNLFPSFCKGAKGSFLCFDITDHNSFDELNYWIETIREKAGKIPIILLGTKADLNRRAVSDKEIHNLIDKYELNGIYFSSINETNRVEIFKQLIRTMYKIKTFDSFSMILPDDDYDFDGFMKFYSLCPICEKRNHYNYLKRFYFSNNNNNIRLKKELLKLLEKSDNFKNLYFKEIKLGIPCCRCYEKYFGKN